MTTIYRGFFNGDSTGIGKGRQMAGIILDSIAVRFAMYSHPSRNQMPITPCCWRILRRCLRIMNHIPQYAFDLRCLRAVSMLELVSLERTSTSSLGFGFNRFEVGCDA